MNLHFGTDADASPSRPQVLHPHLKSPETILLRWQPNPEPDLLSYRIYRQHGSAGKGPEKASWTRIAELPAFDLEANAVGEWLDMHMPFAAAGEHWWYGLSAVDSTGRESDISEFSPAQSSPRIVQTSVENVAGDEHSLGCNPNPVYGKARVTFAVTSPVYTEILLTDLLGRQLAVLAAAAFAGGVHETELDSRGLAPGVYTLVLQNRSERRTLRLTVLR